MGWPVMTARTQIVSQLVLTNSVLYKSRTQYASQLVLTNPISCQRVHKIYLNLQRGYEMNINFCLPNPTHDSEDTKFTPTFVNQTHPIAGGPHVLRKPFPKPSLDSEVAKCISTSLDQPSTASEERKCISSVVDESHPMTARTQNAF
jgi:hypothetical protein